MTKLSQRSNLPSADLLRRLQYVGGNGKFLYLARHVVAAAVFFNVRLALGARLGVGLDEKIK